KTAKWVNNQGQIAPGHTALGKSLDSLARRVAGGEQLMITEKKEKKGGGGFKLPAIFGAKN
ncbi:MAG: hypothetical protein K8F91_15595, partial [Candidatus Obscuribacterales bacterium]|nr:hypothetical protein [Candidatus Obscuribacterales bacterium]